MEPCKNPLVCSALLKLPLRNLYKIISNEKKITLCYFLIFLKVGFKSTKPLRGLPLSQHGNTVCVIVDRFSATCICAEFLLLTSRTIRLCYQQCEASVVLVHCLRFFPTERLSPSTSQR